MNASEERIKLPAGDLLFAEGDAGSCAYIVRSGSIEIFLTRDDGEVILGSSGPGEIIGEMAILDARPRSASARVAADCELIVIDAEQIAHRVADTDPILQMFLKVVISRYRETLARLNQITAGQESPPRRGHRFEAELGMLALESELRRALQNGEFELYFQPVLCLSSSRLAGFEALLRWQHPARGLVLPGEFISIAESCGLITELTDWCLAQAGTIFPKLMTAALHNAGEVDPLFLSVNISGHDLARASFIGAVESMLKTSGIQPNSIKLEVTESILMKDPAKALATLAAVRNLGLGVCIDDFGTGYSSLSYLSTLPVTTLKIDQSFVRSMTQKPASQKIVQMILRLAEELDIPVVAEGIERQEEAKILAEFGCGFGQGYFFGKPVPLDQTLSLIRQWQARDMKKAGIADGHRVKRML